MGPNRQKLGQKAVVIGAGRGGLLAARVLADYERFVRLHATLFLALQAEREAERLRQAGGMEPSDSDEDVPD